MKLFLVAALFSLLGLVGGILSAQADIDVQVPVGTSVTNGQKVKDGKSSNGATINYTVRITNAGASNLNLIAPVVQGGGYESVQVNMTNVPGAQTLTPAGFVEFDIAIDPDKDSKWSFVVTITSDDPVDPTFIFQLEGTQGSPDDDDDDCSTHEGGGTSVLILFAIFSSIIAATRMRGSRS